jgi:hypothetical protein|tara:strand:+ start:868 stop:1089 length:222 start_codon:yes stop_codon:yes gene_type:complete
MDLEKVLQIANECVDNDSIPIKGLTIGYKLDQETHKKLDEELFENTNNNLTNFVHNEVIEINLAGITFVFEIE